MAIYKSFDQLNGKTLRMYDIVSFGGLPYGVGYDHLHSEGSGDNAEIFEALGIKGSEAQEKLCAQAYGYGVSGGVFPQAKFRDLEALTRIALVLLAFVEGSKSVTVDMPEGDPVTIVNPSKNRFKFPKVSVARVGSYLATVYPNKIKAGCQTIPFSTVEEVYKEMLTLRTK